MRNYILALVVTLSFLSPGILLAQTAEPAGLPSRWSIGASAASFTYERDDQTRASFAAILTRHGQDPLELQARVLVSPGDRGSIPTTLISLEAGARYKIIRESAIQPYIAFAGGLFYEAQGSRPGTGADVPNNLGPMLNGGLGLELSSLDPWRPFLEARLRLDGTRFEFPGVGFRPQLELGGGFRVAF